MEFEILGARGHFAGSAGLRVPPDQNPFDDRAADPVAVVTDVGAKTEFPSGWTHLKLSSVPESPDSSAIVPVKESGALPGKITTVNRESLASRYQVPAGPLGSREGGA